MSGSGMRDVLFRELAVGNSVVTTIPGSTGVAVGKILHFSPKMVRIECFNTSYRTNKIQVFSRYSRDLVKISDTDEDYLLYIVQCQLDK